MHVKQLQTMITEALKIFSETVLQKYTEYDTEGAIKELELYIQREGKLIRPTLMLVTYSAYGGTDIESVMPAAVAIELFHQFALAHDDIIDGDSMRGDQPSLGTTRKNKKVDNNPRRILLGDILHSLAYESLFMTRCRQDELNEVCLEISRNSVITGLGVLSEPESGGTFPLTNLTNLLDLYDRKTGHYTFSGPMAAGYILARGNHLNERLRIKAAGLHLGRYFQARDDICDMTNITKSVSLTDIMTEELTRAKTAIAELDLPENGISRLLNFIESFVIN